MIDIKEQQSRRYFNYCLVQTSEHIHWTPKLYKGLGNRVHT